jgi:hypothetical protein
MYVIDCSISQNSSFRLKPHLHERFLRHCRRRKRKCLYQHLYLSWLLGRCTITRISDLTQGAKVSTTFSCVLANEGAHVNDALNSRF